MSAVRGRARAWFDGGWNTVSGQECDRTGCCFGRRGACAVCRRACVV